MQPTEKKLISYTVKCRLKASTYVYFSNIEVVVNILCVVGGAMVVRSDMFQLQPSTDTGDFTATLVDVNMAPDPIHSNNRVLNISPARAPLRNYFRDEIWFNNGVAVFYFSICYWSMSKIHVHAC